MLGALSNMPQRPQIIYLLFRADHVGCEPDSVVDQGVKEADHGGDRMSQPLGLGLGGRLNLGQLLVDLLGRALHLLGEVLGLLVLPGREVLVDGGQGGRVEVTDVHRQRVDGIVALALTRSLYIQNTRFLVKLRVATIVIFSLSPLPRQSHYLVSDGGHQLFDRV